MKLTESAVSQLLASIRVLCECDHVQINDKGIQSLEYASSSTAEHIAIENIRKIQHQQSTQFISEINHSHGEYSVAMSMPCDEQILVSVQAHESPETPKHEQRKHVRPDLQDSRQLDIELVSLKGFPPWLNALCSESHIGTESQTGRERQTDNSQPLILLRLCASLFSSLKVFSQFHLLTVDGLTKLQSRSALQRAIDENIDVSGINLCMIHCRDFQIVNRKFGQAKGDQVLNEIASIISQNIRSGDLACRFGGALFGIASHAQSVDEGLNLAQKLQGELHNRPYLQNAIRLSFNLGVSHVSQTDISDEDSSASSMLISRAEQALKAAQTSDKPSIVHWEADKFKHDENEFNYIGGIFTPDNVTNYRNMLLLWDISSIIADEHEFSRLLLHVVERLAYTFEFTAAGIVSLDDDKSIEQAIAVSKMAEVNNIEVNQLSHLDRIREIAEEAIKQSQYVEQQYNSDRFLLVPLGADLKACFFLVGQHANLDLTRDSMMLFAGFARQIGKALKRSQLEDELNKRLELQNAELAQELSTLKSGLQSSALVYRSVVMQNIVNQTQRAAKTDTTVLITGESGTGKEKLIHAIHNLSPRNKQPLVIVDCGSIPETLIESELFGYVKGAFTGAQNHSTGKIQAAHGGILVLDEIGELPMSMQPKLLRFVQEKHFTPVGGTKANKVDVKIVAVTNRDLAEEVNRGHFRQDLYYRLNVLSLHNPPLRERLEDLPLLCQHFLSKFASQFETSRKFVRPETIEKMQQYPWPGNIRELENKLMQASLMCQGDEIQFDDINIETNVTNVKIDVSERVNLVNNKAYDPNRADMHAHDYAQEHSKVHGPFHQQGDRPGDRPDHAQSRQQEHAAASLVFAQNEQSHLAQTSLETWQQSFVKSLHVLLDEIISTPSLYQFDIGSQLENDLFALSLDACKTNKDIASRLRIPVSTARRKVLKVKDVKRQSVSPALPKCWSDVHAHLSALAQGKVLVDAPLDYLKRALLSEILRKNMGNMSHAAQLMGVSEPTLYKLKRQL
ncbi:sigma 54-interacting transcriptional regulator [Glaciecola siphonariae]|uniref:Sigma 54-interacting transcriptional regulator n=1 Tax=Glaciecola siphonariae TaxID=521012 RepID=A0ABV9LXX0_9ALTE